jgi:hypothetical protein
MGKSAKQATRVKQEFTGYGTLIVPGLGLKMRYGGGKRDSLDVVTSGEHAPYSRGRVPAAVGRYIFNGGQAYLLKDDGKVSMKFVIRSRDGHFYLRSY